MSKSLGNVVNIKDALRDYRPEVIRMFMLSAHYSNPVDYSDGALDGAQAGWERLYGAVRLTRQMLASAPASDEGNSFNERLDKAKADFKSVMDDDFNAPKALAVLQELTRDVNTLLNSGTAVGQPISAGHQRHLQRTGRHGAGHYPGSRQRDQQRSARGGVDSNADRYAECRRVRARTLPKVTASATNWRSWA